VSDFRADDSTTAASADQYLSSPFSNTLLDEVIHQPSISRYVACTTCGTPA
ncbi:hypothetical protein PQX77_005388, partial [Marasmius sp. AFHP31]